MTLSSTPSATPSSASTAANRAVMVVDDDRLVLLTLGHGLRQAGFEVLEADNGDDAILMARAKRPALALLDIRMQGLSGFDVAQHLKDYERIPFIFVSAFADEDIRNQAQALGALACLSKPVDMADLVRRVGQVLQRGDAAAPAATAARASGSPESAPALPPTLDAATAMALGLLMQRESLGRAQAWLHLQSLAKPCPGGVPEAARQLLDGHESVLLGAGSGPDSARPSGDV